MTSLAQIWQEEETFSAFADAFDELRSAIRGEDGRQTELITIPAKIAELVIYSLARTPNLYTTHPRTYAWINGQVGRIQRRGKKAPAPINVPLWIADDILVGACNPGLAPAVNDWAESIFAMLRLTPITRDRFQTIMGRGSDFCRCRLCRGGSQ